MAMQVVNRQGEKEDVRFDAIHEKLSRLAVGLNTKFCTLTLVWLQS